MVRPEKVLALVRAMDMPAMRTAPDIVALKKMVEVASHATAIAAMHAQVGPVGKQEPRTIAP